MKDYRRFRDKIVEIIRTYAPTWFVDHLKRIWAWFQNLKRSGWTIWSKLLKNRVNLRRNRQKAERYLEIGAGNNRIPGFETLDVVGGGEVDYVLDSSKPLPFDDDSFDLIYTSHVLEHIPWYQTEDVLEEWVRILKPGGRLEVWVPDGLKICDTLLKIERRAIKTLPDDWDKLNPRKDPFIWVNGRLIYGARLDYPSWHRALFTPRYLKELFSRVGLVNVVEMDSSNVRGYDHGWINLGIRGTKT